MKHVVSCSLQRLLPAKPFVRSVWRLRASQRRTLSDFSVRPGAGNRKYGLIAWSICFSLAAAIAVQQRQQPRVLCEQAHPENSAPILAYEEVQKHTSPDDCWVIIKGHVYDVTSFLEAHPGGQQAILLHAGQDASDLFTMLHPPNALDLLPPDAFVGFIDAETLPVVKAQVVEEQGRLDDELPPVQNMMLLQDFEHWAEKTLSDTAWAYYRSASDEERSFNENRDAFRRYFLRPRVLCGQDDGSLETTLMGRETSMPVFISPAALAKLGHSNGEVNLTEAAGETGVIQIISANASCSPQELFEAKRHEQNLVYQIYLNKDRQASEKLLQKIEKMGAAAIVFTVDVGWQSKRTLDVRVKAEKMPPPSHSAPVSSAKQQDRSKSISQQISGYQDRNLTWNDIAFIRRNTTLPLIVKGVQCLEDIALCVTHNVDGVVISNHGGRQADYAPAPIDILYEVRCLRPDLFSEIDIYIDGGVRCGADVVKALALGAKGVGIGRPVMYANGTHGKDGVKRVLEILHEEITNTMRNIGVARIQDLKPEMVGPKGAWVGANRPPYVPDP